MLPGQIKSYLEQHDSQYQVLTHLPTVNLEQAAASAGVRFDHMIRAVALIDGKGLVMAILPANQILDFSALCKVLDRELEPVPAARLASIFDDCDPGCCPPLAAAYGMEAVIDRSIAHFHELYFEPGCHTQLVRMQAKEFLRLFVATKHGRFSRPVSDLQGNNTESDTSYLESAIQKFTPARVKQTVEEFHELPPIPETTHQLLKLAADPMADARHLAVLVEQDPSLAAQVIRYANSPLYGQAGKIVDVQSAIARVLGFDFVLNLGLGISIGKALNIPPDGPLGLKAYWRHSVYCAALVEKLSGLLPADLKVRRGTAYVAGLLHNLGIPLLGQIFPAEFFLLNRFVAANPEVPLEIIERYVIGVCHDQVGGWLMDAWNMPQELVMAVRHHHDPDYWGPHAVYAQLILLANRLLSREGIGDSTQLDLPSFTLDSLGIEAAAAILHADNLLDESSELDELAFKFAA